jgi:hypothetical protein
VSAGTTGGVTGRIVDGQTRAPIGSAKISLVSASGGASATTNAQGSYAFVSLPPDTYVLTINAPGYEPFVQPGITIQADQVQTLLFPIAKHLQAIGATTARSASNLVRAGTTSDVYSIGGATSHAAAALGGPGGLDQAYSALALVPGVYVPQGQQGWYQPIFIRGGDQDQIGYELDGIPANRSYDNAPMALLSNVGQQELQVYTGGATASSDGQGISGYINSVVKTGTKPGFATLTYGLGSPASYQKEAFEIGGMTGRLSYYAAAAVVNQGYRFLDQFNGTSLNGQGYFSPSFVSTPADLPGNYGGAARTRDRENVVNLHYALPHKDGIARDDLQLLYVNEEIWTDTYSSLNDMGGAAAFGGTPLLYPDQYVYNGPIFAPLQNSARQYLFPATPDSNRSFQSTVGSNVRDVADNGYSVVKLQYQHNMGSSAYLRALGYGSYSNWFIHDPVPVPFAFEYILPNHTFGASLMFADQLNDKHLLTVSGSITRTQETRYYNTGSFLGGFDYPVLVGSYVDAAGHCYDQSSGAYASCFSGASQATIDSTSGALSATTATSGPALANNARWLATENGYSGNLNQVGPILYAASISDQFKPTDRLSINAGVRIEKYLDRLVDESTGFPARQFWVNAYNNENCFGPGLLSPTPRRIDPVTGLASPCPSGTAPVNLTLAGPSTESNSVFEPRVGMTYTLGPDSVLRASYGTYARPPNASWVEYGVTQQDLASYAAPKFLKYGFSSPVHALRPDTSHNVDLSFEHHVHGTDLSFKVSPYYRGTMDQFENILLNTSGAESGINIGRERTYGVELAVTKGDFARDGFAGQLAFTYNHSRFRYSAFANGNSVINNINNYVRTYNAYTAFCGANPRDARCGATASGAAASACYSSAGAAVACGSPGAVANPYYTAAPQPLFDPNAEYMPYDVIPDQPFLAGNGFGSPEVGTLLVNYKHHKLSLTPSLTFSAGSDYGTPLSTPGIDPTGATSMLVVPNPFTGKFDNMGAFSQPWRLTANMQIGYALSKSTRATLTLAGLMDHCVQRGYAWDRRDFCAYSTLPFGAAPSSPTKPNADPNYAYPYTVQQGNNNTTFVGTKIPLQAYLTFDVRI